MSEPRPAPDHATSPRRRRVLVATATFAAVALLVGLALFQPWRLLTRSTIDEALPAAAATILPSTSDEIPDTTPDRTPGTTSGATARPTGSGAPAPEELAKGTFVDGEHATSGTVKVLRLADGSRYVRLEGFSTSDGPDVDVWLTDQPAGGTDWGRYDDGRYVALGDLKATDGNQNYPIPAEADLGELTSVVIWCDRFNVAFGTAAISLG